MNAESRIRQLVVARLADDHNADGVGFIDELLAVAAEVGEIRCTLAGDRGLRFEAEGHPAWEVPLGRAKAKLRMLCARLGVLCTESGSLQGTLYGGEGLIPGTPSTLGIMRPNQWQVRVRNTASEQSLAILPGARISRRDGSLASGVEAVNSATNPESRPGKSGL
jgi:hypothetical protein